MQVDWLASLPDLRVLGVPGVPAQKSAGFAGTPQEMAGVPRVPEHPREHLGTRSGTPERNDKPLKNIAEHREHLEHPVNAGVLLKQWGRGVGLLDRDAPLGGYALDQWRRIVRDCDRLLADFGKGAAEMGWSTIDLFGFPPGGAGSVHNLGGLVWRLDGSRVIALDDRSVTYRWPFSDTTSRFSRGYLESCLDIPFVPVWELQK